MDMDNSSYLLHSFEDSSCLTTTNNPFQDPLSLFTDPLAFFSSVLDVDNGVLRAWWVDPMVATIAFAIVINMYWYQERKQKLSVENFDFEPGQLIISLLSYWGGIFVWKLLVPPAAGQAPDGIPSDLSSLMYLCMEIISGVALYDFLFFFVHWAMHDIPFLKRFHRSHHGRLNVEAKDVLRHSLMDGSLQVVVNIFCQRHTPWGAVKSRLARAIHNILVIWMLTESHTSAPSPDVFRWWCVGVREHRLHHLAKEGRGREGDKCQGKGKYGRYHRHQQFFGYLDDLRVWLRDS